MPLLYQPPFCQKWPPLILFCPSPPTPYEKPCNQAVTYFYKIFSFCTMIFCIEKQLFWISLGHSTCCFIPQENFLEYLLLYSKKQIKSAGEKKEFLQNRQKRTAKLSLPHWISSFWYQLLQHCISKHFSCRESWIFRAEKKYICVFTH